MSLENFEFPHDRPPPGWTFDRPDAVSFLSNVSVSSTSQAVKDRDECCLVTGWRDGTERAHLAARSILWFFTREELDRYNVRTNLAGAVTVDDMAIAITLTQVVHTALDKGTFIFVPKCGQWVSHFLDPTYDLGPEYHNFPMKMPSAVSQAFVFVNVAVTILSRHRNFFMRGETRRVIMKRGFDSQKIVDMTGPELQALFDPPKALVAGVHARDQEIQAQWKSRKMQSRENVVVRAGLIHYRMASQLPLLAGPKLRPVMTPLF